MFQNVENLGRKVAKPRICDVTPQELPWCIELAFMFPGMHGIVCIADFLAADVGRHRQFD